MKIQPLSLTPPWPYSQSRVLTKPPREYTLPVVLARLERFNRDGVLDMGSRLLWFAWHVQNASMDLNGDEAIPHLVMRVNAAPLMTLAAMYCRKKGREDIDERDFRRLCWELHLSGSDTAFADNGWGQTPEFLSIKQVLDKCRSNQFIGRIPDEEIKFIEIESLKSRNMRKHYAGYAFYRDDPVRAFLLYENFRKAALGKSEKFQQIETQRLGAPYETFKATWFGVIALAGNATKPIRTNGVLIPSPNPPIFNLSDQLNQPDWADMGRDDFRLFTLRFSWPLSAFRTDPKSAFESVPAAQRHRAPQLLHFESRPIIDLDEYHGSAKSIAVVSPYFLWCLPFRILLGELLAQLNEVRNEALCGGDPYVSVRRTRWWSKIQQPVM